LLEKGEVEVFRMRGGEEELIHTYDSGSTFGELAILYNSPRAATCRAKTACTLWTLDRYSFKVLALAACIQRRELYMQFLGGVPLLSTLSNMELMALADATREVEYAGDEVVCLEGERGDFFGIIREGEAIVTQKDPDSGFEKVIAALKTGKYFGEIALITNKHRTASVRSAPKQILKVLTVDRATFKRILGPLDDIMRRNMETYNDFFSQGI
jgi:cAMP-dependent protein kinase regulator